MRGPITVILAFLAGTTACAGANWPNFHGPTNNNFSDARGLPLTWSETENVVWKTPIHGSGWSSPVIWANQIWLTTATDDGKQSFALCVDRQTGRLMHDIKLFDNEHPEDTRQYNSFASCTPVIEAGRVYVHFGSYGTACLDTESAKVLWARRDLPCRHYRGPGSSPILFENLLIMHFDGFDYQYVIALDKATGNTVWKTDRKVEYGTDNGDVMKAFSTPLVIAAEGRLQLISTTSKAALAYDPRTGAELWRVRFDNFSAAARPIFGNGLVYINTGFPKGELLAIRPDGAGDVTKTHVVWHARKSLPSMPSSLLIGESIFSIDDTGVASCLDAKNGTAIWTHRVGGEYSASPIYVDGRIYLFSYDGKTTVIAPERKFKVLAENHLADGFRASPAVAGRSFFLRSEKNLYRIALEHEATGAPSVAAVAPRDDRVRLIFDTDMGNDIDDALALGVIHALQSRGECELLAVTVSKDNEFAAPFVDLVNTFYGRSGLPIGVVRAGKTPEDSKYIRLPSEALAENGRQRYPHQLLTGKEAPEAVSLLRRTLAAQPDVSVVIAVVGFSTNLARLLDSPADAHSPLPGGDLVASKCRLLVMMAGMFGDENRQKEYNVTIDLDAAKKVFADWPTPLIASGFEIGQAIKYPASSIERDFRYVPHHPLREAYMLYQKMPYDRETWDLTAVLYAIRPEHGYFGLSQPGTIRVDEREITQFAPSDTGRQRFLTVTQEQIIRVKEALVQLASQPPLAIPAD